MKLWKQLKMLDPGKDFTLPSIKIKENEVVTNGIALFNQDKLTGLLPLRQSVLFVLLTDKMGKSARITQNLQIAIHLVRLIISQLK